MSTQIILQMVRFGLMPGLHGLEQVKQLERITRTDVTLIINGKTEKLLNCKPIIVKMMK